MKFTSILLTTLWSATGLILAQAPDVILYNGRIFTSNQQQLRVEALAIRGERISAAGTSDTIRLLAGAQTRLIDLGGRTVIPGFNDAHWHQPYRAPVSSFTAPAPPGLVSDPVFEDVLTTLAAAAATVPASQVLQTTVGPRVMDDPAATRFELDRVAPNHRVWVAFVGHGRLLNTAALRDIGIGEEEPDPVGGWYEREEGSRRLTGKVFGYADMNAFKCQQADVTETDAMARIRTTVNNATQFGVTSVQDIVNLPPKQVVKLLAAADVPIRWRVIRNLPSQPLTCPGMQDWSDPEGPLHPMVTLSGYKWFIDGTPGERLMATWESYADRPDWFGRFYLGFENLDSLIGQRSWVNEQLLFHTSGNRAADNLFLTLFNLAIQGRKPLRPRLEHGDLLDPYQLARIAGLGLIVVHNPMHSNLVMQARVGPRADIQPIRSIVDAGIPLAFGSDGPGAGQLNPFLNLQAAVTHPANPQEALTREQAVIAYTAGSAYAEMAETQKGTLTPGMLADLAVLSGDIFTIPLEQFPNVRSVLTMVGGKIVYQM